MRAEDLFRIIRELEKERNLPREALLNIIKQAIAKAYQKHTGREENLRIDIDFEGRNVGIYVNKIVVERVKNPALEISLQEAKAFKTDAKVGEVIEIEVTPFDFGRIAAQTAKQVLLQKIREVETQLIREEFAHYAGKVTTGIVLRKEGKVVYLKVGRAEAILPHSEQVAREHYHPDERLKVYVLKLEEMGRGPQVIVSRTHPGLVKGLFELEVPEISEGIIEIKGIAREPGVRTKLALATKDPRVDPIGACVGPRGARVQAVVNELRGEKIDLVRWSPDTREYIANALSPAKVEEIFLNEEERHAIVIVPEEQLSLAIGKEGLNVRLAAKLVGWRVDIKTRKEVMVEMGSERTNMKGSVSSP